METHRGKEWPAVAVFVSAAGNVAPKKRQESVDLDSAAINAKRIQSGKSVGENWIYGGGAAEMLRRGLIVEGDLDGYRSSLFFGDRNTYGEVRAAEYEAERRKRHRQAMESSPRKPRKVNIPDTKGMVVAPSRH